MKQSTLDSFRSFNPQLQKEIIALASERDRVELIAAVNAPARRETQANKMRVSENIPEEIFKRVTIPEILEMYGIKTGRHGRIPCPIHKGKNLNFSYNDNFYQCWKCGCKGNVIGFVMQYFGINFSQSIIKIDFDFGLGLSGKKLTMRDREAIRKNEAIKLKREKEIESDKAHYRSMTDLYRILWRTSLRCEIDGLQEYLNRLEDWLDDNLEGVVCRFE